LGAGAEFELRDDAPPRIVEMPGHLPDGGADFLRIARRKRVLPVNLPPEGDQEAQHEISSCSLVSIRGSTAVFGFNG
jgi:hypothetical protein